MVSSPMQQVMHQVARAIDGDCPVLLVGEKGTGKRLIAETIHQHSERRQGPFVAVHVAAIPAAFMESHLFGCVGSELGGLEGQQIGELVAADGGTVYIDEISGLTRTAQAQLLRALEKHRVVPIGDDQEQEVDVRLIAATGRDLDELVEQGRFRADLNYQLNVVPIHVPPLRERREDIPSLVRYFLGEICSDEGLPPIQPEPELMRLLEDYDWPGNVRQLRDCLRSMIALAKTDRLTAGDLCTSARHNSDGADPPRLHHEKRLAELERMAMVEALEQHGGNRTCAAEALGISVRTLQRKLKKWSAERATGRP
jgi:DNA-binding NtrC family response regulator